MRVLCACMRACVVVFVLQQVGCQVSHAKGDTDRLVVQTAIESASESNTVLVGDDTDLLV